MTLPLRLLPCALLLLQGGAFAQDCSTTRANEHPGGGQSTYPGVTGSLSYDARFVAFETQEPLVAGDPQGQRQIFVRDRRTGAIERVSRSFSGPLPQSACVNASISADGRFVAYESASSNIVPGDSNSNLDIFLHDRTAGTTALLSRSSSGQLSNGTSVQPDISADGSHVAFASDATNLAPSGGPTFHVFVHRVAGARTLLASRSTAGVPANRSSFWPALSGDGRFVAFVSLADNLAPGDTNLQEDAFVRDLRLGVTELVSAGLGGQAANGRSAGASISDDGRFVAFASEASNLVAGDTNGARDIFVRDRVAGSTRLVSVSDTGALGNAAAWLGNLSADGARVAFESFASNLVPGDGNNDSDVFLRDLHANSTIRLSVAWDGGDADGWPSGVVISGDGRSALWWSLATNLVPDDTNGQADTFVRDCPSRTGVPYCSAKTNSLGCVPAMETRGAPSGSAGFGFDVRAREVLNRQPGMLLFGTTGAAAVPFQGGLLCVAAPLSRAPVASSGGTPPPAVDCSGVLALDLNALMERQVQPALAPGARVWAQWWSRDPGAVQSGGSSLSDAMTFRIGY